MRRTARPSEFGDRPSDASMNEPRRPGVLIVQGAYYPELSGGGLQSRALVRTLKASVDFLVFTTTIQPSLPAIDERDGVPVFRVVVTPTRTVSKLAAIWRFTRLFIANRHRFSVVHLHGFSQKSVLFIALAGLFGKSVAVKLTSVGHDDPVTMQRRGRWAYWWYSRARLFIGVSPRMQALYEQAGLPASRFRLIANGVDTGRFRPGSAAERLALRGPLGLPTIGSVVLFVGFFSREKRPEVLFDAWLRATESQPMPTTLCFVGATRSTYYEIDRRLVAHLRRKAQALDGTSRRVVFIESTLEIEKVYRAADLFVLPSIREGLPNALLEAMSSGLGCIASRLDGVTDTMVQDGKNGRLIEPSDTSALVDVLRFLLARPELARDMGRRARATVEERFNLHDTGREHLAAYRSLTSVDQSCVASQG